MKTRWLKENEYLSAWLQTVGVITALIFGAIQLRDARIAVEAGVEANNIELTNRVTDLLTRINEAALDHPEVAGEHTGVSRLHLMRLEYFL